MLFAGPASRENELLPADHHHQAADHHLPAAGDQAVPAAGDQAVPAAAGPLVLLVAP